MFAAADGSFQFQVRQAPLANSNLVSVNSAVATQIDGLRVALYADRDTPLLINGIETDMQAGQVIALGGGSVHFDGDAYVITNAFGDGISVSVTRATTDFLTIRNLLGPDRGGQVVGLFGNGDGEAGNDLQLRDGTVLSTAPIAATDLYGVFAEAWRVTQDTSLFDYRDGETTETFTDRTFPPQIVTLDDLDPQARAAAEEAAINAGLVPGTFEFETTVLDVALSGDTAFADATQIIPSFDPDFDAATDFALVTQTVVNAAPTAAPDSATTDEDTAITVDVLANDTDPEGDALTLLGAADINGGAVQVVDGQLRFTPAPNFNGSTVISCQLGDAGGNTVTGALSVTVTPQPDDPVALPDGGTDFITDEDTPLDLPDLLANDSDPDGETVSLISIDTSGLLGSLTERPDGGLIYDPGAAFQGLAGGNANDVFSYRIGDGTGRFAEATVTLRVAGVNDAPTLGAPGAVLELFGPPPSDPVLTLTGRDVDTPGALSFSLSGPDAAAVALSAAQDVAGGRDVALSLALRPDGTLPRDANRNGAYEVTVTVSDGTSSASQDITLRFPEPGALIGSDLADTLDGVADTTQIFGRAGDDLITTGGGRTDVFGGDGLDTLTYAGQASGIYASLATGVIKGTGFRDVVQGVEVVLGTAQRDVMIGGTGSDRLFGNGQNDTLFGDADGDFLNGGRGADLLDGGAGDDALRGDSGVDRLVGGLGDDNLYGGTTPLGDGNVDTFIFRQADHGIDRIKDFETGRDLIDLTDFGLTGFAQVAALATNTGSAHLRLTLSAKVAVVIENYRLSDLEEGDFLLVQAVRGLTVPDRGQHLRQTVGKPRLRL